jgi:hypothetical protein
MTLHGLKQIPGGVPPTITCNLPATAVRTGADRYVAELQTKLAIADHQRHAWLLFAASLFANRWRMQAFDDVTDLPFGCLEDRLAARDGMTRAAADLLAVLDSVQRRIAGQLLPLCCLPGAVAREGSKGLQADKKSAATADLIHELERNAQYYCAGPDREAGHLLRRAAQALADHP